MVQNDTRRSPKFWVFVCSTRDKETRKEDKLLNNKFKIGFFSIKIIIVNSQGHQQSLANKIQGNSSSLSD
ncbi:hypothetical protein L1987_66500 [Smallanthus sonchifolius]|uniref:Uncharacterized protein n=1 Tax=Smallanthus sonchifolius TaxID=185202 RepID=A0ACB9BXJ6_9ASTR|nr:hypothetical protein L1987_66500 [Smallanthus sonchifolius]